METPLPQLAGGEPTAPATVEEPPKPAKRITPVVPVTPPPPQAPAKPEIAGPARAAAVPATVAAPATPAEETVQEAAAVKPAEPPVVAAAPAAPIPKAVEAPVKTVSMTRPEPAGVSSTAPETAAPATEPEGSGAVPSVIAQPDIPQELRPPGVPVTRPAKLPMPLPPKEDEKALVAKLPGKIGRTQKKDPLLPPPDPEPGIVYVVPFITLMVPEAVRERIFDQFVDKLNASGANRKLRFVILKEPLEKIDREWLDARKYVFGEIFGYVEDSGCCSTDLRAKARLTYYRAHHSEPTLRYEFPVRTFFEHNQTTIEIERNRIADQIANALVAELSKALQQ